MHIEKHVFYSISNQMPGLKKCKIIMSVNKIGYYV